MPPKKPAARPITPPAPAPPPEPEGPPPPPPHISALTFSFSLGRAPSPPPPPPADGVETEEPAPTVDGTFFVVRMGDGDAAQVFELAHSHSGDAAAGSTASVAVTEPLVRWLVEQQGLLTATLCRRAGEGAAPEPLFAVPFDVAPLLFGWPSIEVRPHHPTWEIRNPSGPESQTAQPWVNPWCLAPDLDMVYFKHRGGLCFRRQRAPCRPACPTTMTPKTKTPRYKRR